MRKGGEGDRQGGEEGEEGKERKEGRREGQSEWEGRAHNVRGPKMDQGVFQSGKKCLPFCTAQKQ